MTKPSKAELHQWKKLVRSADKTVMTYHDLFELPRPIFRTVFKEMRKRGWTKDDCRCVWLSQKEMHV